MSLSNHLIMIEQVDVGEYFDWLGDAYKKMEPEGLLKDGPNCVKMRYPSKKELDKLYLNPWQQVRLIPEESWGDPLLPSPTVKDKVTDYNIPVNVPASSFPYSACSGTFHTGIDTALTLPIKKTVPKISG